MLEQHHIDLICNQVPGGAKNIQDIYPLAPLQEGILFNHMLRSPEEGDTYVMPTMLAISGRQQLQRFLKALNAVVARHDVLRTAIFWEGLPRPLQVVLRESDLPLRRIELDVASDALTQLKARVEPENLWIDLKKAPLIQIEIAEEAESDQYYVIVNVHHIINDHVGLEVLVEELELFLESDQPELAPPRPYREFIAHTLKLAQSGDMERFFQSRLGDFDEPSLPFSISDIQVKPECIVGSSGQIDNAKAAQIHIYCKQLGISAASFFHLAWAMVVGRSCGHDDVVFGTVLSGRLQGTTGAARTVGMFLNTLPIRLQLKQSVEASLKSAHRELLELITYEQAPLSLIHSCSALSGEMPLFTSLLNYRNNYASAANSEKTPGEQIITPIEIGDDDPEDDETEESDVVSVYEGPERTNYPISVSIDELEDESGFEYNIQVVDDVCPERLSGYLSCAVTSLVTALEEKVDRPVSMLEILPASEREQLIARFNQSESIQINEQLIHARFEAIVDSQPDSTALVFDDEALSYAELNARANRLAHHLQALGVAPEVLVGVCMERSLDMVVGILAILKAGGAYVPMDPAYPNARLAWQVEDADLKFVLTQCSLRSVLSASPRPLVCIDDNKTHANIDAQLNSNLVVPGLAGQNLAYVIYTSGTTGNPKGCLLQHDGLVNLATAQVNRFNVTADSRVLQFSSLGFDACVFELCMALTNGASLVVPADDVQKDPALLGKLVRETGVTHATLPPSLLAVLDQKDWRGVEVLVVAGEACSLDLARRWQQGRVFINAYGPSEATVCSSAVQFTEDEDRLTIGSPLPNVQHYVVDSSCQLVPLETEGELLIGGAGLARGYLHRPQLTAEKFVLNPFSTNPNERLYRTGDRVRWLSDGRMEFLGRVDHQVKLRGYRIEPGEIENLIRESQQVDRAVVVLDRSSDAQARLVAYVTAAEGEAIDTESLRDHLATKLPDYMLPSHFMVLDSIPLTINGKIDRKALPTPDLSDLLEAYEAPENEIESLLADIWQDLLEIETVGRQDNFFQIGGHSLLVVRLISRLQTHDLNVDVRTLFDNPILKDMAVAISGAQIVRYEAPANLIDAGCEYITPALLPLVDLTQEQIDAVCAQIPGGASNIQDIYPLAPLQEGILFHHMLSTPEQGDNYIIPTILTVPNQERLDAFFVALNAVVARHDALRTAILWSESTTPVQVVLRHCEVKGIPIELDKSQEVLAQLRTRIEPENLWMSLNQAPLLKIEIASDPASERFYVIVYVHHINSDHVGLDVLLEELEIHLQTENPDLPDPVPYREFVSHALEIANSGQAQAYFESRLGDFDEPTLPFGITDVQVEACNVSESTLRVDNSVTSAIRRHCNDLGISTASFLHLAWAIVLGRCSARDDVVMGTVMSGRLQGTAGADQTIGVFINTLPIRVSLNRSVRDSLSVVHSELLDLMNYEQTLLTTVHGCSALARDVPLFSSFLNYRHDRIGTELHKAQQLDMGETAITVGEADEAEDIEALDEGREISNYPVVMAIDDMGEDGLEFTAQVINSLDPEAVNQMLSSTVNNLLLALENEQSSLVSEIEVLPESQQQTLTKTFNQTQTEFDENALIHQLFEDQVRANADAIAVSIGEQQLSFAELNERSNQLAHFLIDRGVGPDSLTGLCVERSMDMVVGIVGILKAGGAYVPLDVYTPENRLEFQIDDAGLEVVLTHKRIAERLSSIGGRAICLDDNSVVQDLSTRPVANPADRQTKASNLAYVMYTSGSTGQPKGVMIEHYALVNNIVWMNRQFGLDASDKVLQKTPFSFDASVWEFLWPLCFGGQLVIAKPEGHKDPQYLSALIEKNNISIVQFVPSMLSLFVDEVDLHDSSIKKIFCLGEALTKELQNRVVEKGYSGDLINLYGPTEATIEVSYWHCNLQKSLGNEVPIGYPIHNTQLYVLNQHLKLAPPGVAGELYIGGASLARGYLNRADLTQQQFVADPFSSDSNSRLYKTGDLVRWLPDGSLEYLGRTDHQIKLRGFRIELGDIETHVRAHESVNEAVVVVRKIKSGDDVLVAYLTAADDHAIDTESLHGILKSQLPAHMLPARYIVLDALPLTINGKVNRSSLPTPDFASIAIEQEPPQGATELLLAQIWVELLGVDKVGRDDSFFELGGHSLLAIRLVTTVQKHCDKELTLQDVFDAPKLSELATLLDCVDQQDDLPLSPVDRSVPLPLSWAQQRLWYVDQLEGPNQAYHLSDSVRFTGEVSIESLRRALTEVVARHEILRTDFVQIDGEAKQIIQPEEAFELTLLDLRKPELPTGQTEIADEIDRFVAAPFSLSNDPKIRGQLLRISEDEHVFVLVMHHIVSDAWSMDVFVDELTQLYDAYCNNRPSPLPRPVLQYGDYAVWQHNRSNTESMLCSEDYWRTHLSGAHDLLTLPVDHKRPVVQSFEGDTVDVTLSSTSASEIKNLASSEGLTVHMILYAAWVILLSRLSGQDQVVVGTPVANRQRHELAKLIGFFVNVLPLRADLSGNPSVREILHHVRELTLSGYAHQEVPFERIVELLQPDRNTSHSPLFQSLFNLDYENDDEHLISGVEIDEQDLGDTATFVKYDFSLSLTHRPSEIAGSIEFATSLFDRTTVERWAQYYPEIVDAILADLDTPVGTVSMLSMGERQRLLLDFNRTAAELVPQTIHGQFEHWASNSPHSPAIVFKSESLTYSELNRRADQLARVLKDKGATTNDLVGIYLHRCPDMVVALLGILKAGCAYVPLDTAQPFSRINRILKDSAPLVVLTQRSLAADLNESQVALLSVDDDGVTASTYAPQLEESLSVAGSTADEQLAYVIYTSGSTGEPKGVEVEHRGVMNYLNHAVSEYFSQTAGSVVSTALSFDATVTSLLGPLVSGKWLHLVPHGDQSDELRHLLKIIETSKQTMVLKVTPAHLLGLEAAAGAPRILSSLVHQVVIGGEQLNKSLLQRWKQHYLPNAVFINEYGPTETVVGCCTFTMRNTQDFNTEPLYDWEAIPIGKPVTNTQLYVVDEHNQLVSTGVVGELLIGGQGVARGYRNRSDLTAEKFITNPFIEELESGAYPRVYRSGDLVRYRADGVLEFVDRIDDQVKLRGYRIELGEIETQLATLHGVRDTAVVLADEESDAQLVAYVSLNESEQADYEDEIARLQSQLVKTLPEYMVPSRIVIVEAMPLTTNGKVDRKLLKQRAGESGQGGAGYAPPLGETEETLAKIWQSLLKVERVGRFDNFYHLGGHSLLAIKFIGQLKEKGYELSLASLFANQTLVKIAEQIDENATAVRNPVLLNNSRVDQDTSKPLFLIHEVSGHIAPYKQLAELLEPSFLVYGLEYFGAGAELGALSIKSLAASYIEFIRGVQTEGPYRVAGWSAGGAIAYEIAFQLRGMDQEVEFLGLIDTQRGMVADKDIEEFDIFEGLNENVKSVFELDVDLTPLRTYASERNEVPLLRQDVLVDIKNDNNLQELFSTFQSAGIDKAGVIEQLNSYHAIMCAEMRYCMPQLPNDVHLFVATGAESDESDGVVEDEADRLAENNVTGGADAFQAVRKEWADLLGDRIKIKAIDATHATILLEPHVRELKEQILDSLNTRSKDAFLTQSPYSPIVQIQTGQTGYTPVICVPGSAESATCFLDLCQALNPGIPVIAIQYRGLDSSTVPHSSVEHAASYYIKRIKEKLPDGPYCILGHSFGGWVAFEMANQIRRDGGDVQSLILIDSEHPSLRNSMREQKSRVDYLVELIEVMEQSTRHDFGITRQQLSELDEDAQLELLRENLNRSGSTRSNIDLPTIRSIVSVFLLNAETKYLTENVYEGPALLINANERSELEPFSVEEIVQAWRHSLPDVESMNIDGNHMSILKSPSVQRIAQRINRHSGGGDE